MTNQIIIQACILLGISVINILLFGKGWAKKINPNAEKIIDNKYVKIYVYVTSLILMAIAIFELLNPELVSNFFR